MEPRCRRLAHAPVAGVGAGRDPGPTLGGPGDGSLYTFAGGQIAEYSILDGGGLSALTPASVSVNSGPYGYPLAIAPVAATLYAGGTATYSDGGKQPTIYQFDVGLSGVLSPAAVPAVSTPYGPIGLVAVESDAGGPYLFALGQDSTFQDHLSQYTTSAGSLVANSPAEVSVCASGNPMTYDPADNLLLVPCPGDNTIQAFTVESGGTLTEASWSPAAVPIGPSTLTVFRTSQ